jgi:hypothetical protein
MTQKKSTKDQPKQIVQLKKWLRRKRKELQEAGAATIIGSYSGDGDEGRFDGIDAVGSDGGLRNFALPQRVKELIESLADELSNPNYEDGTGGGGEIRLKVDDASITHESYDFVIERSYRGEETY